MRFTAYNKLRVVRDYQEGKDISTFMDYHGISQQELDGWVNGFNLSGVEGLKARNVRGVRRMEAGA